ncbi:MAG: adenylate/guanylate cyclase domain-containing protein [Geminicoccaceae bacterium]
MPDGIERKLTTILAADVAGYSRLMAADEVAALASLRDGRAVFARLIERHRGRIANTAGDGLVADFPSVVEAVQCAVEVQRELAARNDGRDPDAAMRFRIGLHLGDVMVDRGDLFGEGVNLAARLQELAEPGGILISQPVYDQVRAKLALGFDYLGERRPKNLPGPVSVYRLRLAGAPPPPPEPALFEPPRRTFPPVAADPLLEAKRVGLVFMALALVNLATSDAFWAIWPGIVLATWLGLRTVPHLAPRADPMLLRLGVAAAALAAINLVTDPSYLWFLWPTGVLGVLHGLRLIGRQRR